MKKAYNFFRSMKFGIILLVLFALISIAGSLIPQSAETMTYVQEYPKYYQLIFALSLDHVFTSWYFILLSVLLCVNLFLCSIVRITNVIRMKNEEMKTAFGAPIAKEADGNAVRKILEKRHCHKEEKEGRTVYFANSIGRYGTFIVHLGILLTVVFWSCSMYVPKVFDEVSLPGDSLKMSDGTVIQVESFHIEDPEGTLDFASVINVTLPNGKNSGSQQIKVNHPLNYGDYKIYQQTYGTKGSVRVKDQNGNTDSFYLTENDMLSADGKNGVIFKALYPDYIMDEDGRITFVTSTSGHYDRPVYVFIPMENGVQKEPMIAFPDDTMELGEYTFTFETPTEYPGLRIKRTPGWINLMLILSLTIMTIGFYITFFMVPVLVVVEDNGYTVLGVKKENTEFFLKRELKKKGA